MSSTSLTIKVTQSSLDWQQGFPRHYWGVGGAEEWGVGSVRAAVTRADNFLWERLEGAGSSLGVGVGGTEVIKREKEKAGRKRKERRGGKREKERAEPRVFLPKVVGAPEGSGQGWQPFSGAARGERGEARRACSRAALPPASPGGC